ncbi:MAG: GHMP family kinase ATP-binding protein [Planctomycetota bacterium]|jgi:D-glycero-alpha-D-manno-heptose-7-phosphate kinase
MTYEATAPCRADLAGGTVDIWPVHLMLDEPVTVNIALSFGVRASVKHRRDGRIVLRSLDHGTEERFPDIETARKRAKHRLAAETLAALPTPRGALVETWSSVPSGSGLGASSAMTVALVAALTRATGRRVLRKDLGVFASNLEGRVIQVPPGVQDHLAAVHGGFAAYRYGPGPIEREELRTDLKGLGGHLLLAHSGMSHSSAENNWRVVRAFLDGDTAVRRGFREVAKAAVQVRDAVLEGDLKGVAAGMRRDDRARRRLFPGFHNRRTLELVDAGRRAGAIGARPCGAGGGGCLVFLVPEGRGERVTQALHDLDAEILPVMLDRRGVRVRTIR